MDKELFTAKVQRDLSYLVVGGIFFLILLDGLNFGGTDIFTLDATILNQLITLGFAAVVLFWLSRQRQTTPDGPIPPGSEGKTVTEETRKTETVITPGEQK